MKKFVVVLLILVISLLFGFSLTKILLLSSSDSPRVIQFREKLAKNIFSRKVFALHFDGDAKSDYLSGRADKLFLEVDYLSGTNPDRQILEKLKSALEKVTGKETVLVISSEVIDSGVTTDEGLSQTKEIYQNFRADSSQAVFYLFLTGVSASDPGLIGGTLQEDGAVIYLDAIADLGNDSSHIFYSTALHEFGHQLGLDHNDFPNCLMNPELEIGRLINRDVDFFCAKELEQIQLIKQLIK